MQFDLIVFDCDGVLVDSEPIVNRVFVEMLGELGFVLDVQATLKEFCGASMASRIELNQRRLGWKAPGDFLATFNSRLNSAAESELTPVPDDADVLDKLSAPWCVASNGSLEEIRHRLGLVGILGRYSPTLFSALDVGRSKPAPDVYLHAAKCMGVGHSRCAVIEDSLAGAQAGRDAGMVVFGYAGRTSPQVLHDAGAKVFDSMSALPGLLNSEFE
jgi:HAD superfamily hydrolase (TIGR01509 family)